MSQESRLERKLRQLGINSANSKKLQFRVYFPRPPYGRVEYTAAKQGEGLNFVGQLLGHGGCTLKRIQTESGTRVEVHDSKGNLNGTHPSYTDPSLHAVVFADNREKLNKAVRMIAGVLQPLDATFEKFEVVPGGSALLKPATAKKSKSPSPRSETSSQSQGPVWGGISTPSSENGSVVSPTVDLDSAYVQETHQPWRTVKTFQESSKTPVGCTAKVSANKKEENGLCGMRPWDTWGRNDSDGYNQFTMSMRTIVSQYAKQSVQQKQPWEQTYYTETNSRNAMTTPWSHIMGINGSNVNSSFSHFAPSLGVEFQRSWEKEPKSNLLDGFPLPHVYEDLIGVNEQESPLEASRLTSAYHISLDPPHKSIQRVVLPHDL